MNALNPFNSKLLQGEVCEPFRRFQPFVPPPPISVGPTLSVCVLSDLLFFSEEANGHIHLS